MQRHRSDQPADRLRLRRRSAFESCEPRQLLHADALIVGAVTLDRPGQLVDEELAEISSVNGSLAPQPTLDLVDRGPVLETGFNANNQELDSAKTGRLQGTVHADLNRNGMLDFGEPMLTGVSVQLVDRAGTMVDLEQTGPDGQFVFAGIPSGEYSLVQTQPAGYFDGGQAGPPGHGDPSGVNRISGIRLDPGDNLPGFRFFEIPPASLSGYVFQDGATILTADGNPPADLSELRDGRLTEVDIPIEGVVLELRNGITGEILTSEIALPGSYEPGPIRTTTDSSGFYRFDGLPAGNYAIFEQQPDGFADGIDSAGTNSGVAVNPSDNLNPLLISTLVDDPRDDAIIRIPLRAGEHAQNNNFSEVVVGQAFVVFRVDRPVVTKAASIAVPILPVTARPTFQPLTNFGVSPELDGSGGDVSPAWHLSVIDAGRPRGDEQLNHGDSTVWLTGLVTEPWSWESRYARQARWRLARVQDGRVVELRHDIFGVYGGVPITGDFNGDGFDEVGVYHQGQWLLDLSGDFSWNREDLWAKLGEVADWPVTGDWDGDGKDDIGIFGRGWPGDAQAAASEPGLPDQANRRAGTFKNLPPRPPEAATGNRLLKLTDEGRTRADLIDHVFQFGNVGDRPVTGDWNGDGIDTIGVFRDGRWRLDVNGDGKTNLGDVETTFGRPGDQPVVGDWNGDGIDDIGSYRDGQWLLDTNGNRRHDAQDAVFRLGGPGERPVVGDWDGDGRDDIGIYGEVIADVASLPE